MDITDKMIQDLKSKIATKKADIQDIKPTYKTTKVLKLNGNTYNLLVQRKDDLELLLAHLMLIHKQRKLIQKEFNSKHPILYTGTPFEDWKHDIKLTWDLIEQRTLKAQLENMEKTLETLLSKEAKTKNALQDIENVLNSL
jgi:hypothetical protein